MLKELESSNQTTTAYLVKKKSPGGKTTDRLQSGKSDKGKKKVIKREVERETDDEGEGQPLVANQGLPGEEGLGKIMTNFHR
jgi:hypothetical protein